MTKKILDNFGSIGLIVLLFGLGYYSVTSLWDWKAQVGVYLGAALIVVYLAANLGEVRSFLLSRTARLGGAALATLILGVGILALVNFLNFRHHTRTDFSEGSVNAISDQTRKVLENLDQEIQVVGFFSEEGAGARFQNLVREYRFVSSKFSYEVVDPQEDPNKVAQYQVTRDGQVAVISPSKREMLDEFSEEKLTNTIIKVTRDDEKVVYFLTGHGERGLDDSAGEGFSSVKEAIEKQNYRVESYNLAQENKVPAGASVLVSVGPKVDFFPNELQLLEEYLAGGGKFCLLVDPESDVKMNEFLGKYGLGLADDFVVDASGLGQLFGFGAGAPLAADYTSHPITEDLSGAMSIYPGARSVTTAESSLAYTTTDLVRTSAQSWGEMKIEGESVSFDEGVDHEGPLSLIALSTKSISEPGGDEAEAAEEPAQSVEEAGAEDGSESEEAPELESRLVVIGDADFASNAYFGTSVNGDLFLNVVSWLAEDTDLLSIRPKDPKDRSLTLTATDSRLIFMATVIFFPLASLIFGLAVWYRRR